MWRLVGSHTAPLLTSAEAAAYLGPEYRARDVAKLAHRGLLKAKKVKNRWFFYTFWLDKYKLLN